MAYHPLANDTGGSDEDRRNEADRILKMLVDIDPEFHMTPSEQRFIEKMYDDGAQPISPKQLFWLRDIKDKYL